MFLLSPTIILLFLIRFTIQFSGTFGGKREMVEPVFLNQLQREEPALQEKRDEYQRETMQDAMSATESGILINLTTNSSVTTTEPGVLKNIWNKVTNVFSRRHILDPKVSLNQGELEKRAKNSIRIRKTSVGNGREKFGNLDRNGIRTRRVRAEQVLKRLFRKAEIKRNRALKIRSSPLNKKDKGKRYKISGRNKSKLSPQKSRINSTSVVERNIMDDGNIEMTPLTELMNIEKLLNNTMSGNGGNSSDQRQDEVDENVGFQKKVIKIMRINKQGGVKVHEVIETKKEDVKSELKDEIFPANSSSGIEELLLLETKLNIITTSSNVETSPLQATTYPAYVPSVMQTMSSISQTTETIIIPILKKPHVEKIPATTTAEVTITEVEQVSKKVNGEELLATATSEVTTAEVQQPSKKPDVEKLPATTSEVTTAEVQQLSKKPDVEKLPATTTSEVTIEEVQQLSKKPDVEKIPVTATSEVTIAETQQPSKTFHETTASTLVEEDMEQKRLEVVSKLRKVLSHMKQSDILRAISPLEHRSDGGALLRITTVNSSVIVIIILPFDNDDLSDSTEKSTLRKRSVEATIVPSEGAASIDIIEELLGSSKFLKNTDVDPTTVKYTQVTDEDYAKDDKLDQSRDMKKLERLLTKEDNGQVDVRELFEVKKESSKSEVKDMLGTATDNSVKSNTQTEMNADDLIDKIKYHFSMMKEKDIFHVITPFLFKYDSGYFKMNIEKSSLVLTVVLPLDDSTDVGEIDTATSHREKRHGHVVHSHLHEHETGHYRATPADEGLFLEYEDEPFFGYSTSKRLWPN